MIFKKFLDEYAIKHDMFYTNRQLRMNGQTFQDDDKYLKIQGMICQDINQLDAAVKGQLQKIMSKSFPRSAGAAV